MEAPRFLRLRARSAERTENKEILVGTVQFGLVDQFIQMIAAGFSPVPLPPNDREILSNGSELLG